MRWISRAAYGFEEVVGALTGLLMLGVVTVGVFYRIVLHDPIQATEEIALACFVWMVFIGASAACREDLHAGMDAVVVTLPEHWRQRLRVVSDIVVLIVAVAFVWLGWRYAQLGWSTRTMSADLPMFWVYVSLPLGGCLIIWRVSEQLLARLRGAPARVAPSADSSPI